jgi:hypothetical protein
VLEYLGCFRRRATSIDEFCRAGVEFTKGGDPGVKLRARALTTEGKNGTIFTKVTIVGEFQLSFVVAANDEVVASAPRGQ